jgi:DNA-binding MarR family transcriptional regulator
MSGVSGAPQLSADGRQIFTSIRRLVQYVRISGRALQRHSGLTAAQLVALEELDRAPGISLAQLAERCCTDESSACVVVARLVDRGLVNRERAQDDARRVVLTPTDEGRAIVASVESDGPPDQITDVLERVEESERATFADMLERIVTELTDRRNNSPAPAPMPRGRRGPRQRHALRTAAR